MLSQRAATLAKTEALIQVSAPPIHVHVSLFPRPISGTLGRKIGLE